MVRGFLDELEQGIEALGSDHVGLVDDEHLVPIAHRGEGCAFTQVACVVDAAVGSGVHLDHVEGPGATGGELPAGGAVQAAGQDPGRCGLAAPTWAGEEVGVGDPVGAQGRAQGFSHLVLPDHLVEGVGAVPAVQSCGHIRTLRAPVGIFQRLGRTRPTAAN